MAAVPPVYTCSAPFSFPADGVIRELMSVGDGQSFLITDVDFSFQIATPGPQAFNLIATDFGYPAGLSWYSDVFNIGPYNFHYHWSGKWMIRAGYPPGISSSGESSEVHGLIGGYLLEGDTPFPGGL